MNIIPVSRVASSGIAISKAFLYQPPDLKADSYILKDAQIQQELARYHAAEENAKLQITGLVKTSDIFAVHLELVEDPALHNKVTSKIQIEKKNAEVALEETAAEIIATFQSIDDQFFRERATDIRDVCNKIMCALKGIEMDVLGKIREQVILVGEQLTPSDMAHVDLRCVIGFIAQSGAENSHVAIIARSRGIPALVGVDGVMKLIKQNDPVILDALEGHIIVNPDRETLELYNEKAKKFRQNKDLLAAMNGLPAQTIDGHKIQLCANVGNLGDIENAISNGIDGIGLLRSEFIYLENTHFPDEEEQFAIYKNAAASCPGDVIIRTMDIGGDKSLPYFSFEKEDNPFLGWRAIRISLQKKDIFKTQLKAILRASAFGKVKIMYPMIISIEELAEAEDLLKTCKKELAEQGVPFDSNIPTGMMVETPAAVVCIDDFAKRVDFFSIGTNDLTQYILAVDRGNKRIANLYDSFHPAVIRSIEKIIAAGHRNNIPVGMCGELAGNEMAVPLLLGLGLDEFSMAASKISEVRYLIRNLSYQYAKELAEEACQCICSAEVRDLLEKRRKDVSCH
jgi:phosphoenolpyruvate-protein phosphotransferase (PTS system enzyme I)